MDLIDQAVHVAVKYWPEILPFLSRRARHIYGDTEIKTYDYYRKTILHLVQTLWDGYIGGEFVDIMNNLIHGQLSDAYEQAIQEHGLTPDEVTPEMREELSRYIIGEQQYVQPFFRDIVIAKTTDGATIDQFLNRAELWANRYNEVYNAAVMTIAKLFGEKLRWELGATEEHCATCSALNGFVAYAADWDFADIHPGSHDLACGGWRCDCRLVPTTDRRRPNAANRIRDIVDNTRLGQ